MRTEARTEIRIDTPVGPVRGTRSDGVVHAGGVPYAQAERWGVPDPITWAEPLDATQPGAAAPQVVGGLDLVPGMTPSQQSEHCLTTEIWTPSLDGRLPVIVWVPGGSYRIGGASLPTYDGSRLASESAVVVGVQLPPRGARLARRRRGAHEPRAARPRRRARVGARDRARLRWRSRPHRADGRVGGRRHARAPARDR